MEWGNVKSRQKNMWRSGKKVEQKGIYAALDLGTNNCRMLVAEPSQSGFRILDAFSRIVRLGEGVSITGRLGNAAMKRTIDALMVCQNKMEKCEVTRSRFITTQACRMAENSVEFVERAYCQAGIELEIIDCKTEARLAVSGCAPLMDHKADCVLLFDIGGGSSELIFLDFRGGWPSSDHHIIHNIRLWTSLPIGIGTLTEKYGSLNMNRKIFESMVGEVRGLLASFKGRHLISQAVAHNNVHFLGTAGTATILAGMHLGLRHYDRQKVDGTWMSHHDIHHIMDQLLMMNFDERSANPCIGTERADFVISGCAILEALYREWPCERLRVADRGLREGLLIEMMDRDGVWPRYSMRSGRGLRRGLYRKKRSDHYG